MPPTQADVARDRRANIESEHNALRDAREKQFVEDKIALESDYQADIQALAQDKREAFAAEGLNSDGSDPQGRPQG